MTDEDLQRPLDETIRRSFEEYRATFDEIDSLLRAQTRFENVLSSGLMLYRWTTGDEHEVDSSFWELRKRGRELRGRREERMKLREALLRQIGDDPSTVEVHGKESPDESPLADERLVEVPRRGRLRQIHDVLVEVKRPMKASEISKRLVEAGHLTDVENPVPAVAAHLSRGCREGIFIRPDRGLYALSEEVMAP